MSDKKNAIPNHLRVPSLFKKYEKDYQRSIQEFPQNKKIDLIEHLLHCLDLYEASLNNSEVFNQFREAENNFIKKHARLAKTYVRCQMNTYYMNDIVLAEKEVYTTEQWNQLDQKALSPSETQTFIALCRNFLSYERQYFWLEQPAEYEGKEIISQNPLAGAAAKSAEEAENKRRMAMDKATALSQEQTVLLLHYLKEVKIFLRENNLSNKDAGIAFGILTGYSHDTLRQKLGKVESIQSHDNLEFLYNYVVRLLSAIEKDLKKKDKPE